MVAGAVTRPTANSKQDVRLLLHTFTHDDLAYLLARADMAEVLKDFGRATRQEDPVVHFYETFLAAYDPQMRQRRGVYYTPEPVVSYIVRSLDHIVKTRFDRPLGLASGPGQGTTLTAWVPLRPSGCPLSMQ